MSTRSRCARVATRSNRVSRSRRSQRLMLYKNGAVVEGTFNTDRPQLLSHRTHPIVVRDGGQHELTGMHVALLARARASSDLAREREWNPKVAQHRAEQRAEYILSDRRAIALRAAPGAPSGAVGFRRVSSGRVSRGAPPLSLRISPRHRQQPAAPIALRLASGLLPPSMAFRGLPWPPAEFSCLPWYSVAFHGLPLRRAARRLLPSIALRGLP